MCHLWLWSIAAQKDHFVQGLSVCQSNSHTFLIVDCCYFLQATHAFLGKLSFWWFKYILGDTSVLPSCCITSFSSPHHKPLCTVPCHTVPAPCLWPHQAPLPPGAPWGVPGLTACTDSLHTPQGQGCSSETKKEHYEFLNIHFPVPYIYKYQPWKLSYNLVLMVGWLVVV